MCCTERINVEISGCLKNVKSGMNRMDLKYLSAKVIVIKKVLIKRIGIIHIIKYNCLVNCAEFYFFLIYIII